MIRELRIAMIVFLLLTVVTGVVYPGLVTLVAAVAFPAQAGGSLIKVDGKLVDPIEIAEVGYQVDLGERFRVEKMSVKGIKIDLPGRRIDIAEVLNAGARARMVRNKAGKIEWVSSPVLKVVRATNAKKDAKAKAVAHRTAASSASGRPH